MELQAKVYTRTNDSGTHYARIVVPKALRIYVKKPALWKSLSTQDDKEAAKAGSIVAASTQIVLQEVSDANAEATVVVVNTEIVGNKLNLAEVLDKLSQEDIALVAQSLREKLGIKNDDVDKPSGGSKAKKTARKTNSSEKSDAADPKKMAQDPLEEVKDNSVARFIEKRPHGVYRFRYWIPNKLQKIFGQREVRKTLRTEDRLEAIERARPILHDLLCQLQQIPT
ncbi:MAG: hypothetical protein GY706_06755 [Bacteroides sp.]|nr:hypothetical protein [Bacteroides sp.]